MEPASYTGSELLKNEMGQAEGEGAIAGLVAAGELDVPIASTFPLDDVRAAFEQLEQGHTRGKIVLLP